jgi:hypothetical protein
MYTLYYARQSPPNTPGAMWVVRCEDYESIDSPEPIEGSQREVSRNLTRKQAHDLADARQRQSYAENRKARTNG